MTGGSRINTAVRFISILYGRNRPYESMQVNVDNFKQ